MVVDEVVEVGLIGDKEDVEEAEVAVMAEVGVVTDIKVKVVGARGFSVTIIMIFENTKLK